MSEGGSGLEIRSFETLPSTQRYLIEAIRNKEMRAPAAVRCAYQSDGVGSRERGWEAQRGNLFASFAFERAQLPSDLPLVSASIYFMMLMKKTLQRVCNDALWVKWPNDLYLDEKKVGGCITTMVSQTLVCGIGVNLKQTENFAGLRKCRADANILFNIYIETLETMPSWKLLFREYEIEFEQSRAFSVHTPNGRVALKDAILQSDGSIIIDGKRIVSER